MENQIHNKTGRMFICLDNPIHNIFKENNEYVKKQSEHLKFVCSPV